MTYDFKKAKYHLSEKIENSIHRRPPKLSSPPVPKGHGRGWKGEITLDKAVKGIGLTFRCRVKFPQSGYTSRCSMGNFSPRLGLRARMDRRCSEGVPSSYGGKSVRLDFLKGDPLHILYHIKIRIADHYLPIDHTGGGEMDGIKIEV